MCKTKEKPSLLPTEATPPQLDMKHLITLVYGPPFIGKSTFCKNAPKPLFLCTEGGLKHLKRFDVAIRSWQEFLNIANELSAEKHSFKTVIIKTCDGLSQLCSDYVLGVWSEKSRRKLIHESDLPLGKGWSLVRLEFSRVINRFCSYKFNTIFISHCVEKTIETRTGTFVRTSPSMGKVCHSTIYKVSDLVLYFALDKERKRIIHCQPDRTFEAGGKVAHLPDTLPMDWHALVNALSHTDDKEYENEVKEINETKINGILEDL